MKITRINNRAVIIDPTTAYKAKVMENRGLKVNPSTNTSIPVDLYFVQALGAPTTLTAATAEEDKTISVASTAGFAVGQCLLLLNAASDRFYFADVLNIAALVLTVDSPLDFAFDIGDTVLPVTRDMNIDASVTNQIFEVQAGGVASTLRLDITRVIFTLTDATAMDDSLFGGIPALVDGVVLRRNNGVMNNIYNIKSNSDFGQVSYDKDYALRAPAGSYGLTVRSTFAGTSKHGATIRLDTGDSLQLVLQDNLTGLTSFRAMAQGHIIDETTE